MTNSTARPSIHATTRCLLLLLAVCAAWPVAPPALAVALPVPSGLTIEQDDHNAILQWNFDPKNPVTPLPAGVMGYKITWGPASAPNSFSKLTEERIIQLQPLDNGKPYVARIQSVDSAGHLSAPSASISFTGTSARVDALRARMNGFFDDFNLPAGAPDERKWNSAYSRCNADWSNGFFINDQYHAHNTVFSGNCDRSQSISRPRATLDFTDNGTRTIVFDWDGEFRRSFWYLDVVPRLMDITGQVNIEGTSFPADPAYGIRFSQNDQSASIFAFGPTGAEIELAKTDFQPYPPLDYAGVKQVSNVRRHWEIHMSRDQIDVSINGKKVMASAKGAFNLPEDHYYLLWNVFSYNTAKDHVPFVLGHWDNFGFDAPAGTQQTTVTHNYRLVNIGTDYLTAFGKPAQATLNIPDQVGDALAQRLMFTLQTSNSFYAWSPNDKVLVNGTAFPIPKPTSNAQPQPPNDNLVGVYAPFTVIVPLPAGLLKQGANQISFNTSASGVHNIHAELDFSISKEPPYTPPAKAIGGTLTPAIPEVGPNVMITQIGKTAIDKFTGDLNLVSVLNPTVSGIVPIRVEVHQDVAMQATGNNVGVRQIELLIDKRVVLTQRTDAEAGAPSVVTTLNLDTRSLSKGAHEIYFRAFNTRCVSSIPEYLGAGAASGSYFPLHINVQNSAASVADDTAAATLSKRLYLPIIRTANPSGLPDTCVLAAAQADSRPTNSTLYNFLRYDAVRDKRRVLICEL